MLKIYHVVLLWSQKHPNLAPTRLCLDWPFPSFFHVLHLYAHHSLSHGWTYQSLSCLRAFMPGRSMFNSGFGKIPWRRKWQPTPVFLPGEAHGQRSHRVAKSQTQLSDWHFHFSFQWFPSHSFHNFICYFFFIRQYILADHLILSIALFFSLGYHYSFREL